jgi:hypothetical protein
MNYTMNHTMPETVLEIRPFFGLCETGGHRFSGSRGRMEWFHPATADEGVEYVALRPPTPVLALVR